MDLNTIDMSLCSNGDTMELTNSSNKVLGDRLREQKFTPIATSVKLSRELAPMRLHVALPDSRLINHLIDKMQDRDLHTLLRIDHALRILSDTIGTFHGRDVESLAREVVSEVSREVSRRLDAFTKGTGSDPTPERITSVIYQSLIMAKFKFESRNLQNLTV